MRNTFIETLCTLAESDSRIWLVCGDLGYSVLEIFASKFPDRFLNAGVSEQNMTSLAAGLASCGKIVFTYSIANFPVMRCLEQIRNDICYHNANVKVVAVGGGLAYGPQGYTHHGVEDLAVTRVLPNMTVVAPADPVETRLATRAIAQHAGPCYLRLGKAREPIIHQNEPRFELGQMIQLRPGTDLTLISTGGMLGTAAEAARLLEERGISARVLSMHTITEVDRETLRRAVEETRCILSIEEHGAGGLGSVLAEVLLAEGLSGVFHSIHLGRTAIGCAGSQEYLREKRGLGPWEIAEAARSLLIRK